MKLDTSLITALRAIEPYLQEVVVVGGWVPHIYAAQLERTGNLGLLTTRDVDLAVSRGLPHHGQAIDQLLEAAGFVRGFRSLDTPPVTAYVAGAGQADEVEIEFITTAGRTESPAITVQSGLSAQSLRFVEILLERTWTVPPAELTGGALQGELRLPTPAAYVFHRSLTYRRRKDPAKREEDLYDAGAIRVLRDAGALAASTTPDSLGHAHFDLPPGTYRVECTLPTCFTDGTSWVRRTEARVGTGTTTRLAVTGQLR